MSIGDNIRRLREQHQLTQRELGEIAGVSDKAVSTWELGLKEPRMATIARIAAYFGVPKSVILDDALPGADVCPTLEEMQCAVGFASAFERLCNAWGRTPERVERDLGISHTRLMLLRRAQAAPTTEELDMFVQYFRVPHEVLLNEQPPLELSNLAPLPPEPPLHLIDDSGRDLFKLRRRIPVLGRVPAGIPLEAVTDVVEEIDLTITLADDGYDYFGLMVTGDSMYPEYLDGDMVILRVQSTAETGDDVVAYIGDSDATLKRLTRTDTGICLRPLNPDYPTRTFSRQEVLSLPVTIAGVVIEQRRRRRR